MALYCKIIDVRKPSRFQAEAVYELRDDNGQPAIENKLTLSLAEAAALSGLSQHYLSNLSAP